MFHSFESTLANAPTKDASQSAAGNSRRRLPIARACEPCRRRKVRCSGHVPCESCQWHNTQNRCHYLEAPVRPTGGRRYSEKTSSLLLNQYQAVVNKLFPDSTPAQLSDLGREELIDLAVRTSPKEIYQRHASPQLIEEQTAITGHPDADSLETFQPIPDDDDELSGTEPSRALLGIQDDVNALTHSARQPLSYLGISSVMAILRVIVWLDPDAHTTFKKTPNPSTLPSCEITRPTSPSDIHSEDEEPDDRSRSAWNEIPHINAYFQFFHPMVPLLDEQSFRDTYLTRERSDSRWLLLLNVVLALGSAISGTVYDTNHRLYYARLRRLLTIETLGSAHIETVQALTLLSGYYLHYLPLPNLANTLMGTTIRLAIALGLHRDYPSGVTSPKKEKSVSSAEIRRRIWWSIFCLDACACGSLGRPSMGRMNAAVTVKMPQHPIGTSTQMLMLFRENVNFSTISTRAEDALATSAILSEADRKALDTEYVEWFRTSSINEDTPKSVLQGEAIGIRVLKNIMRWRYLWFRSVLHRPVLLWYAMRKMPFEALTRDRQMTVDLCRDLTKELISDISKTWGGRNQCIMSSWHAAWILYQATMVPLLSLFLDPVDETILADSHAQVQLSMQSLSDQVSYAHTAKRSFEVVSLVYEASKGYKANRERDRGNESASVIDDVMADQHDLSLPLATGQINASMSHDSFTRAINGPSQEIVMENMFDSLNWSMVNDDMNENLGIYASFDYAFDNMDIPSSGEQYFVPDSWVQPSFFRNESNI